MRLHTATEWLSNSDGPARWPSHSVRWSLGLRFEADLQASWMPEGKTVALVRVVGARKRDGFDAIRMTWRGPRRVAPILDIRSVSSVTDSETQVAIDAGMARGGTGEAESWEVVLSS